MGCSTERTIEKIPEKNKGYPVCRLTVQLTDEIDCLVSYDSNRLLLGGKEEFQMFDLTTKNISTISKEHKGRINCLIKLENNKVVSGSQDKTIKIWDIEKKECLYTLEGHTSIIWEIKSLTKNRLISAADDNTSRIWNLDKKSSEYFYKSKRHISSIAVLDNNRVLLTSGKNILLFDINTKEQLSFLDISVWVLKTLKNGDVAAGGRGFLYILQITDEIKIKTKFGKGHNSTLTNIIELENENLVTSDDKKNIILWDRNDPESVYLIEGHKENVMALCYIEGNKFASVSIDKELKIWE